MRLAPSYEFHELESWINILLNTFTKTPSTGLALSITFYVQQILLHDDISFHTTKRCEYITMQRFWRWQALTAS